MELPSLEHREMLLRRYARLTSDYADELGKRPLVWPNAQFFPDAFLADEASCHALMGRMQRHAGLADVPIEVKVFSGSQPSESCSSGGCGPAASPQAGRLEETGDGWRLHLPAGGLRHAVGLTTNLALALSQIFLLETSNAERKPEPPAALSGELAAVALGLGTLLLQGSYVYSKSCGGPSIAQMTQLSVAELSIVTAAFAVAHDIAVGRESSSLGVTQQACFRESLAWAESNREALTVLATDPGSIAEGAPLPLVDTRSRLQRWWQKRQAKQASPEVTLEQALAGGLSDAQLTELGRSGAVQARGKQRKRDSDLAALVDEALRST